jgi:ABC-type nitrate/sulfonate/bicarbonate transport system ATPase subunit
MRPGPDIHGGAAPRLTVDAVNVSYVDADGERRGAVSNIDVSVAAGEFAAVIGPSGCGKSTLLNAIAGLVQPDSGVISLNGDPGAPRLGHVAYMQQRDLLLPWRTVAQNALLGLEFAGVGRDEAVRRALELARRFGLAAALNSYPWQLSGGMRQRAALLRSSLPDTGVLLLDEPFGALDAITRSGLQRWLAETLDRADRAIVLVTHDVEEALLLADRVYVMSQRPGTIIERIDVALPRPRPEDAVTMPEFVALKSRLLHALATATAQAAQA